MLTEKKIDLLFEFLLVNLAVMIKLLFSFNLISR
jgi:hypothetical protein